MKYFLVRHKEIDSTNSEAKRYVHDGGSLPVLIFSETQTEGRGRMGRSFYSLDDRGVYMTVVLKAPVDDAFLRVTALAGVCAVESLRELFGVKLKIKWVNDLYIYGKKAGGILTESFFVGDERYIAVGFGINLYTDIPAELHDIATSIFSGPIDSYTLNTQRNALIDLITKKLLSALEADDLSDYMEKYRALSCVMNAPVTFIENGVTYSGTAFDITDSGALCVRLVDGSERTLASGEISVRLN